MRTRRVLSSVFATGFILFVGAELGAQVHSGAPAVSLAPSSAAAVASPAAVPTASPSPAGTVAAAAPKPTSAPAVVSGTFRGAVEQTQYGSVQVSVTVAAGKITDVAALKLTDQGGRSVQISAYAAPVLRSEVLTSQSAKVSSVSGATYTSSGYLSSVQSALDNAHLA
jgi:uncharacterized protein with FMN-binding domain